MKTKTILVVLLVIIGIMGFGQRQTIELTFTAVDNTTHVQLDSIKVMNRTQEVDTVLYWPDTVLSIYFVGISEPKKNIAGFQVFQNYPNPVTDKTTISFNIPEKDIVSMIITDILGRVILQSDTVLDKGIHSFRFSPGGGNLYFFIAHWRGISSSIKIIQATFNSYFTSSLEYIGSEPISPTYKTINNIQNFFFSEGDELLYIGYANTLQSGILDAPEKSETNTFQFSTNIPCPGTPTVTYEGQVYNTIQIFSQCWLKENLNVGIMIPGNQTMTDNGVIEKYCYNNKQDSCDKYGSLYQWWEMMQYIPQQFNQGICPAGWHIPMDEEWKVLEGALDSQNGIGNPEWDFINWRGFDAGAKLKTTSGWNEGGNGTDLFGFASLPAGERHAEGSFNDIGDSGNTWSSTNYQLQFSRYLWYGSPIIKRWGSSEWAGLSVRCIKD